MTKVANIHKVNSDGTWVRIDRSSPWVNPYIIGIDGDRELVCAL